MSVLLDWIRTAGPAEEPISVADAKRQCNVFHADDDGLFVDLIASARHMVEEHVSRGLFTQTWQASLRDWADEIPLPRAAPLQSITSVQYYANDGTLTTLASSYYDTRTTGEPAVLFRKPNQVWPTLQSDRHGRIVITYVVGWSSVAAIPDWAKRAMLLLVEHFYSNRGPVVGNITHSLAFSVDALLAPHRVWLKPPCAA